MVVVFFFFVVATAASVSAGVEETSRVWEVAETKIAGRIMYLVEICKALQATCFFLFAVHTSAGL